LGGELGDAVAQHVGHAGGLDVDLVVRGDIVRVVTLQPRDSGRNDDLADDLFVEPSANRPPRRMLTGDRPTGPLHLGHYVGTLADRVRLQTEFEPFVLVADYHMLTTSPDRRFDVADNIREDVLGNLAVGVDPEKATIYLQSQVPETAELLLLLGTLVSVPRVRRIPTLKDKLRETGAAEPSYGLLGYPILQASDILLVQGEVVPVGRDQASHVELTREIVRSFNAAFGPVFREPVAMIPDIGLLPGIDGDPKMGRSRGNAINLFDDGATVESKVMSMYTDPARIHATDPGRVEGNPVFAYHDAFNPNGDEVTELKELYRAGRVGDVEVKRRLALALNAFLEPIRARRAALLRDDPTIVEDVLEAGRTRALVEARSTLEAVRAAMGLDYFRRSS
jgi:tryptophanyl-tRNA synthetase